MALQKKYPQAVSMFGDRCLVIADLKYGFNWTLKWLNLNTHGCLKVKIWIMHWSFKELFEAGELCDLGLGVQVC